VTLIPCPAAGAGWSLMALKCDFLRYNHSWYLEGQLSRDLDLIGLWGK
jgi:hypothetical protein